LSVRNVLIKHNTLLVIPLRSTVIKAPVKKLDESGSEQRTSTCRLCRRFYFSGWKCEYHKVMENRIFVRR